MNIVKRTSNRIRRRGFTLVEVLVVMTLLGFLLTTMFSLYFFLAKQSSNQHQGVLENGEALQAMNSLARDLNNIYFEPNWDKDRKNIAFDKNIIANKKLDSLTFPTTNLFSNPNAMKSKIRTVSYFVQEKELTDTLILYRSEDAFVVTKDENRGIAVPILKNIQKLEIEFSINGTTWLDNWDYSITGTLPRYIRVHFAWIENKKAKEFVFEARPPLLWNR